MAIKENLTGYLFILPNIIGLSIFTFYAIGFSMYISLTDWSLVGRLKEVNFVGWQNYADLMQDRFFWVSLWNNLWFLMVIPVQTLMALVLAILLHELVFTSKALRVIYFLPHITNMVAILIVWNLFFSPSQGPVNEFLRWVGIDNPPKWQLDQFWAKPTIAMFGIWSSLGFNAMIYLSALAGASRDLYEAAEIDGAGKVRSFFRITLPLISPTTFFLIVLGVIGSFNQWSNIQVFTEGGPGDSTYVLGYFVYKYGFEYFKMGYASAAAWVLTVIIVLFTMLQWFGQRKWVHYN